MSADKNLSGKDIRARFLEYFNRHGHEVVDSSSLVPHDDPTLLFTNAGMNQFKDVFLGRETRAYNRAATCQKVVRAGGKHNDLENVGRTARHHTFFEMLGNFSFGDYFKEDAIKFGWEFLTKEIGLDADKMFATVYLDDDEAFDIWRNVIGLPEDRVLRKDEKDNFWAMGDTGPCGPCSEIHYDRGPEFDVDPDDEESEGDRYLELWNLVFMQFNRSADGTLNPLPKPSIDTGMGLERVAAVVQSSETNYDTDLIRPIIDHIAGKAGKTYNTDDDTDVSLRVIADHARSTTFLISDGVLPANEGRGNVLRRIMRRAMRHGKMLGISGSFFYDICEFVIDFMKDHYIELTDKKEFVSRVVQLEEENFGRTLSTGMKLIDELMETYAKDKTIPGDEIFKLYDTFGFPVDLLEDIAGDAGFALDIPGFNAEMAKQQERAKKSWSGSGEKQVADIYKKLAADGVSAEFTGYDELTASSSILAIVQNGRTVDSIDSSAEAELVIAQTPFYPEGGGQLGDSGVIKTSSGVFSVTDTKRQGDVIVHFGSVLQGGFSVSDEVTAEVNLTDRRATEKNHTATHLLHKALRTVLGEHVRQAGSLVGAHRLRFDFNHFAPLAPDEITRIEEMVNLQIQNDTEVTKTEQTRDEAIRGGAMALFGEKYGDTVRVVEVPGYSRELCGGCHVNRTGQIGLFKIVTEGSVASGVRRLEGVTGMNALSHVHSLETAARESARLLKAGIEELPVKVSELMDSLKESEREIEKMNARMNAAKAGEMLDDVQDVNGVKVLATRMDDADVKTVRDFVDTARNRMKSGIVVVASKSGQKVMFICGVTADLAKRYKAGTIVREVAKITGGGGGGRDDMAQAGGQNPEKIDEALAAVPGIVSGM